jgi:transaldolase
LKVWGAFPDTPLPTGMDRSGRLAWLAMAGYPNLGADTLLSREMPGKLEGVVGNAIRLLNSEFITNPGSRKRCYEVLIEAALNLIGLERKRAGFTEEESGAALEDTRAALREWESLERRESDSPAIQGVTRALISDMKKVLFGRGMVSKMGEEIERSLEGNDIADSFILACKKSIQENVYYDIVDSGLSKIGNDSATGLRWLRHLGAVQVSSNPVIAARAFEEAPELWQKFMEVLDVHPEWRENPDECGDEVAMFATVVALLPNLLDFRPIALLSDFREGMVSIQLNPYKAGSVRESVGDARRIYQILTEILEQYDQYLMGAADFEGRGRPNVVFKVAGGEVAAIEVTESLNGMGIGTNNTVTYTVSQEITLAMAAMRGLAGAKGRGIPITRVYVTNMEGRLEDHLRETQGAELLLEHLKGAPDPDKLLEEIAGGLGVQDDVRKGRTVEERTAILCARKNLGSLTDGWFAALVGGKQDLARMEADIRWAGILVTRRAFGIAFSQDATSKWAAYLGSAFGLSRERAENAVAMVDLLPASKRREEDTLQVLGGKGTERLTNTEFPDQQLKVWTRSRQEGFRLSDFENSIEAKPDEEMLRRLLGIEDFRKAFELTPELSAELNQIGIKVPAEEGGIAPGQWASYGPAVKTLLEFKMAYSAFRDKLVSSVAGPRKADAPVVS